MILHKVERHRSGAMAIIFCNGLVKASGGDWMPARIYSLGFAPMFDEGYRSGRLSRNEHGYIAFKDMAGIPIPPPHEWRQATLPEIDAEMKQQGVTPMWTERVEGVPGTKVQMCDGSWITL